MKRATLLGLPRELRDMIFFELLVGDEGNAAEIDAVRFKQPGICRVNRQLRHESLMLWYDNPFVVRTTDLKLAPQPGHWVWDRRPWITIRGLCSWDNFKDWLRTYFDDQMTPRLDMHEPELELEKTLSHAFDIVQTLAEAGTPWEVVETVLNDFCSATSRNVG